jgi:hypothetical protein
VLSFFLSFFSTTQKKSLFLFSFSVLYYKKTRIVIVVVIIKKKTTLAAVVPTRKISCCFYYCFGLPCIASVPIQAILLSFSRSRAFSPSLSLQLNGIPHTGTHTNTHTRAHTRTPVLAKRDKNDEQSSFRTWCTGRQ